MPSSKGARPGIPPPAVNWDDLLHPPRDPTPGERTKLLFRLDGHAVDICAVPLKIMGQPTCEYNALGWALMRRFSILTNPLHFDPVSMDAFMDRYNCVPVSDPTQATIDVWGLSTKPGRIMVMSFSRRLDGRTGHVWTTKRNTEDLIVHDRYDWRAIAHGPDCHVVRSYKEMDEIWLGV